MRFIMNGQVFQLKDLDETTNNAFIELYAAYLSNRPLNWADFESKANAFFRSDNTTNSQDDFFTNFSVIWNLMRLSTFGKRPCSPHTIGNLKIAGASFTKESLSTFEA